MDNIEPRFNTRAFTALIAAFSGLTLPLTGIANHFYGFDPLTVQRHAWMSAHNALGLVFAVACTWHVILNRRSLWNHLKNVSRQTRAFSRECVFAGALVASALLIFVGHAFVVR